MIPTLVVSRMVAATRVAPVTEDVFKGVGVGLGMVGTTALGLHVAGPGDGFLLSSWPAALPVNAMAVGKTFVRTLMVPALVEEMFWRVAFVPHPTVDGRTTEKDATQTSTKLFHVNHRSLWLNVGFALYHLLLPNSPYIPHAQQVFWDPWFLIMAFMLGNACSVSYKISKCSAWAPILVHAMSVTMWLEGFGGSQALRGAL